MVRRLDQGQTRRVAWRQILRWVEAQFALVDTDMVKAEEVFLPYAITHGAHTVYELFATKGLPALTDKGADDASLDKGLPRPA